MSTSNAARNGAPSDTLQADGGASPAGFRRRLPWIGAGLLLVAAAVLVWRWSAGEVTARYQTQPLSRGDLRVNVSATGTLAPTNTVDVGIEVSGTIASVDVDYNDRVTVGQVLARLDTSKLQAQVLQSQAALEAAKAQVLQARASVLETRASLSRLQRLRESAGAGFVSQQDMDAAQANLDRAAADVASAEAAVRQTQATLDANRTDLGKAAIRSPIDGIVLARSVDPGQTVAANFQAPVLFELAQDLSHMELQVDVDEADVGQVREGQDASFSVDAYPDRSFPARIRQLRYGSETVEGVVTYKAILDVDNPGLLLRPGMTATALVAVQEVSGALLAPAAALRFAPPEQQQTASSGSLVGRLFPRPQASRQAAVETAAAGAGRVWILRDGVPVPVAVSVGASDGVQTVVSGGALQAGTPVIVDVLAPP